MIHFAGMNPEFPETAHGWWLELIRVAAPRLASDLLQASPTPAVSDTATMQVLPVASALSNLPTIPAPQRIPHPPVQSPATATAEWLQTQQILHQTKPITTPVPSEHVSFESRSAAGEGSTNSSLRMGSLRWTRLKSNIFKWVRQKISLVNTW